VAAVNVMLVSFETRIADTASRLGKEFDAIEGRDDLHIPVSDSESGLDREIARHLVCEGQGENMERLVSGRQGAGSRDCDSSVVDRNIALGQKLKINGTPGRSSSPTVAGSGDICQPLNSSRRLLKSRNNGAFLPISGVRLPAAAF